MYNEAYVRSELQYMCLGKSYCAIQPSYFLNRHRGTQQCASAYAQFYVQVLCKHTDSQLKDREYIGMWLSIQAILTAVIYLLGIYWIKYSTSKRYQEWDVNTTTISDYTLMFKIPQEIYRDFVLKRKDGVDIEADLASGINDSRTERSFESPRNDSILYGFKKYLKREFEEKLRSLPAVTDSDDREIVVSEINFSFDNTTIIDLLTKRAQAILSDKDDKVLEIEQKIKDYMRKHKKQLTIPIEAYVTFKTEEAYLRGLKLDSTIVCGVEKPTETWHGKPLVLQQVQEPSNIYWENRHLHGPMKFLKQFLVVFILLLILFAFILVLFITQKVASKYRREYPEVDCEDLKADLLDEAMLEKYALTEWYHWQKSDGSEESVLKLTTSNLQCYCNDIADKHGREEAMDFTLNVNINGHQQEGTVCRDYLSATRILFFIELIVPLLIVISGSAIKHASIILSKWLRFDKRTNEISMIQILCFFILFFNNALAILLINARFEELFGYNFKYIFNGDHTDFDVEWYRNIASFIISPMFIQIFFPITNLIPDFFIQQGLAWFDRRFTNPKLYKTNCKTAVQYAELNSGAEHLLFEKYPRLVNIVMVSMMYAFGLPIFLVLTLI